MTLITTVGEFVVTPVSENLRSAVMVAEKSWSHGVNEIEKAGLTAVWGAGKVRVPLIGEAPISIECRLYQIVPMGDRDLVVGEIVMVHAEPEAIVDGRPDTSRVHPLFQGINDGKFHEVGAEITLAR